MARMSIGAWVDEVYQRIDQLNRRQYKRRWMAAHRRFIAELKLSCGCCFCRYRCCAAALEFHHVQGRDRSEQFSNMGMDRLRDEVSKCLVVCANCHRELHDSERKRPGQSKRRNMP